MKKHLITMSTFGSNGRFGNQIFQYAFLKIYAKKHDLQVQIPRWPVGEYLFGHNDPEISQVLPQIRDASEEIAESQILTANPPLKDIDLWGYFQYHTSYYAQYKEYLCDLFKPRAEIAQRIQQAWQQLGLEKKTVVGLHIRLKDYGFSYFFIPPFEWYLDWLNDIWRSLENPILYIATDEPETVLHHFSAYHPLTAKDLQIELPEADFNVDFYVDFYLLSQCDRVAISNSTFSFAACMLNQRGQMFVRPHLPSQKLIPFEPWHSEPIFRDVKVAAFEPGDLHTIRQQICDRWLSLTTIDQIKMTYLGGVGTDHKNVLKLATQDEPLSPTEQKMLEEITPKFATGINPSNLQYFLAAMLYRRSYQFPWVSQIEQWAEIPDWFFEDFLEFILAAPRYFTQIGDIQKYSQYIQKLIDRIHQQIFDQGTDRTKKLCKNVAINLAVLLEHTPLYFAENNFRDLVIKQTEIIEFALRETSHQVDYPFDYAPNSGKIRLGILQSNFGYNSENLTNLPIFELLNQEKFEVILYAVEKSVDPIENYCDIRVSRLVHLPEGLAAAVNTIRRDGLDILLIGSNATGRNKTIELLAIHRLAKVQVINSVSLITTGMRHIDYYIAGNLTAPLPAAQQYYTEELVNLPGSGLCFKYPLTLPNPQLKVQRSDWGANPETVVFISGANFYKIIPELRETWAKILHAVPNSILVLYPFGQNWAKKYPMRSFAKQITQVFEQYSLNSDRVFLYGQLPSQADVNACLQLADIYLDAYPYTGALSLLAPLQVGLPVVVREGDSLRSRRGAAILQEMGHPELITNSEAAYIQLAIHLANDRVKRQSLQHQLQEKFCQLPPFLDSRAYAAAMVKLLAKLFLSRRQETGFISTISVTPPNPS
jgi:predicted O-linked N-acetylglucosamine transferase (SPINDLY family)